MSRRLFIVSLLIIVTLFLSGCGASSNYLAQNRENENFFSGSEGVRMQFTPGLPPPRLFYYSDAATPDENQFEVGIELENEGASDAIGAVYISGFSPDIIRFEGTDIERRGVDDCFFDFDLFSLGSGATDVGFLLSCGGVEVGHGGAGDWDVRLNDIGTWLGVDVNNIGFSTSGEGWGFHVGWENFGSIDVLNHGRALALILSVIDFTNYNGYLFSENAGVLKGDNYYYPGGEDSYITIVGHMGENWPPGLDELDQTLLVTGCYGYTTFAAPTICIDPAPFDESNKVCTPRDFSWSGSQGAPVAITRLEQNPTPRKVFLTFEVANVGSGTVMNPGYLERCSPYFPGRLDSRHKDVVYIGDIRIGQDRLKCTPEFAVRLNNGRGTFTCEYDLVYATAKSAYETPVVVELWYGYQQSIQTTIHIKRAI